MTKIKSNEYELSGRKAIKFKFKTYKDYLKESKSTLSKGAVVRSLKTFQ